MSLQLVSLNVLGVAIIDKLNQHCVMGMHQ